MGSWRFEVFKTACYVGFPIFVVVMQNLQLTEKFIIQDLITEIQKKDLKGERILLEKKKEAILRDQKYWESLSKE
uniref:Uncharacterized protein n=1 Tax=Magallana gigas TaxID=29159 RepID=A0A8W8LXX3_MAGGI